MNVSPLLRLWTVLAVLGAFLFVGVSAASADKVAKKFKKEIILSDAPFPTSFESDSDMVKYLKKMKKKRKDGNYEFIKNKWGKWEIEFLLMLQKKLNAKQVYIIFYDVTYAGEDPEEVYSTGIRPDDPYTTVIASYIKLSDEFFKVDHVYEMQIVKSRGDKPIGKAMVKLIE